MAQERVRRVARRYGAGARVAVVVALVISFVVNVIAGALSLLPLVLVAVIVWFLVRGGRIRIEFPDRHDRR